MQNTVFITGGTGLVGADIIRRLLRDGRVDRVIALVRGTSQSALPRLLDALHTLTDRPLSARQLEKLTVVQGDVTAPCFGWSRQDWQSCARRVTHVVHAAADVRFQLPLEEARRVNLGGTRMMLDFAAIAADAGTLQHFAYVSTAFVCGERTGRIVEEDDAPRRFSNSYEQSKWECEVEVRAAMNGIPATIFRPSIIVGDSRTGRTNAFKALYAPLRLIVRNMLRSVPGAEAPLDVVPVDYVSGAICHVLLSGNGEGRILHLTAGAERSCSVAEIAQRARTAAGLHVRPELRGLTAGVHGPAAGVRGPAAGVQAEGKTASAAERMTAQVLASFRSYMTQWRDFDDRNTRAALAGSGIAVPSFRSYIDIIIEFCLQSEWGRRSRQAA